MRCSGKDPVDFRSQAHRAEESASHALRDGQPDSYFAPRALLIPLTNHTTPPSTGVQATSPSRRGGSHTVDKLAYRLDEVAAALGISRRTLERERSAGRFPPPDRKIAKCPIWSRETLMRWLAEGGR